MRNKAAQLLFSGVLIASLPTNPAHSQEQQSGRPFEIKTRIALTETWTDNLSVGAVQSEKEGGLITSLAPGIRIDAKTARLKAYFDYALTAHFYSASGISNSTQNALNTFGTLETIPGWLFLDFSGIIAQQAISAFGAQSPSNGTINSNSTETSTYRLSPYIRGPIAGTLDYSLRYNWSTTQSKASVGSNTEISDWSGQLRGGTPFQSLKWSVDATQQDSAYSNGRASEAQRLHATATYTVVPQFRISLSGGSESNNYASQNMETNSTHGYGFDWTPTERTQISAFKEQRFFGDGHRYSLSHRFPLSSIRYSDTKDVSVLPNQFTSVGLGTIYDLFYQICSQQLSSTLTDPVQLSQAASVCASNRVSQFGLSANTQATSSFLSSRATVQRNQQLALAIQGARNTLTLILNRNESQSMLAANAVNDIFSQNNTTAVRQRGFSINLAHSLSALTNISVITSRQKSTGTGNGALEATTAMYQASVTSKLGARTSGSLSVRHSEFDSNINPYTENAIIGTVSVIF